MTQHHFAAWVEPLAQAYRESRAEVASVARSVSNDDLRRPAGDEGWSVRDEIVHIAASDPDFIGALGAIVRGETPDTSLFADIDGRNARNLAAWGDRPMEAITKALEDNERTLQDLLAKLTDEDESRRPDGMPFAIGQLIAGYGQHGPYHLGQIRAALGRNG